MTCTAIGFHSNVADDNTCCDCNDCVAVCCGGSRCSRRRIATVWWDVGTAGAVIFAAYYWRFQIAKSENTRSVKIVMFTAVLVALLPYIYCGNGRSPQRPFSQPTSTPASTYFEVHDRIKLAVNFQFVLLAVTRYIQVTQLVTIIDIKGDFYAFPQSPKRFHR